jgi:hypothetical protein
MDTLTVDDIPPPRQYLAPYAGSEVKVAIGGPGTNTTNVHALNHLFFREIVSCVSRQDTDIDALRRHPATDFIDVRLDATDRWIETRRYQEHT